VKQPIESRQVDAFVDGELDLQAQLEIERQMRIDSSLREQVENVRGLRTAVREQADYHEVPAALRNRLDALAAPPRAAGAAARPRAGSRRRWCSSASARWP
jgi:anti-sigma factor RsiW